MQGGYTSFGAFWIGGLSAPGGVVVIPSEPPAALSGGPFAENTRSHHWEPLKQSDVEKEKLELQILREDGELIAVIIALCSPNVC